jgi:hypothetical protein
MKRNYFSCVTYVGSNDKDCDIMMKKKTLIDNLKVLSQSLSGETNKRKSCQSSDFNVEI